MQRGEIACIFSAVSAYLRTHTTRSSLKNAVLGRRLAYDRLRANRDHFRRRGHQLRPAQPLQKKKSKKI